jgi:uncharacterized membrane protein
LAGALFALLIAAMPLRAQDLPAAFDVVGVAHDDVLNIRALPSGTAEIAGTLAPGALRIEVLEVTQDGRWGKVSTGEGNGWSSMRYLKRREDYPDFEVPRPMNCYGTEPFWSLFLEEDFDIFEAMGEGAHGLDRLAQQRRDGHFSVAWLRDATGERLTLSVSTALCSDGMSDRDFGFAALLLIESPGDFRYMQGCCTLDMR